MSADLFRIFKSLDKDEHLCRDECLLNFITNVRVSNIEQLWVAEWRSFWFSHETSELKKKKAAHFFSFLTGNSVGYSGQVSQVWIIHPRHRIQGWKHLDWQLNSGCKWHRDSVDENKTKGDNSDDPSLAVNLNPLCLIAS